MRPVGLRYERGEFRVEHECTACHARRRVRARPEDDLSGLLGEPSTLPRVPSLPVRFGSDDETVLDPEPPAVRAALDAARAAPAASRRNALAAVVARFPGSLEGWARLGDAARDAVEAYACYRVAYHRGLDRLREAGWRGSGHVRWSHPGNQGFLRGLDGLRRAAGALGETAEVDRTATFLRQLDPDWDGNAVGRDQ